MPMLRGAVTPHLWVLVTEPANNICVIVSVSTLRNDQDQTVILNAGDHPFIRHPSIIKFSDAQFADDVRLLGEVAARNALLKEPCSARLIELVQQGILVSPFTPRKIADYCRKQWGMTAGR